MKDFRTQVFKRAYEIMRNTGKQFAVCLSKAWQLYKLAKRLKEESVTFYYEKVNGSLRKALGTLNVENYTNKNNRPLNFKTFVYFDIEANYFRAFRIDRLIKIS